MIALCVGLAVGGPIVNLLSEARTSQLFGTVLGPFALVYAGAAVAPRHRLGAAIGLATLHALFAVSMVFWVTSMTGASAGSTVVWDFGHGLDKQTDPMWWILLSAVLGIASTIVACVAVDRRFREDDSVTP